MHAECWRQLPAHGVGPSPTCRLPGTPAYLCASRIDRLARIPTGGPDMGTIVVCGPASVPSAGCIDIQYLAAPFLTPCLIFKLIGKIRAKYLQANNVLKRAKHEPKESTSCGYWKLFFPILCDMLATIKASSGKAMIGTQQLDFLGNCQCILNFFDNIHKEARGLKYLGTHP